MLDRLTHFLLGAVLILALACSSCASHRPAPVLAARSEPIAHVDTTAQPVPGIVVQPPRTILDKLTGRTPPPKHYPLGTPVVAGKKSTITINHVAGNQSNTSSKVGKKAAAATGEGATATTVGKVKAPTAIGDSATATDNTKAGQKGGAAATAPHATATATTVKPPIPWLKYALWASGIGFGTWVLFGGGGALLLALWRKNKSTDTTA